MPFSVRTINTTSTSEHLTIIPDATENSDGVMTAEQVRRLNNIPIPPPPTPPPINQRLIVTQADGTTVPFVWTVPFVVDYNLAFSIFTTAATSGVSVNIDVTTKTGAGFTFLFSAPFDGQIEVVAVPA